MPSLIPENGRLDGWKAISDYLGWHPRTVMRWEQQRRLPIHRVPGGQRHAVFAFRRELDEWLKNGHLNEVDLAESAEFLSPPLPQTHSDSTIGAIEIANPVASTVRTPISGRILQLANSRRVIWITCGVALLTILAYTIRSLAFSHQVEFTHLVQLTHDGVYKEGLVTDGRTIYFSEYVDGKIVLAFVSITGGPVHTIPTPFVKAAPADISPDGKKLLVLAWEGIEMDRSLWVVPAAGGEPSRVGEIRCHAAAWSPDGLRIAFAAQNSIYISTADGAQIQQLQSFDATPLFLRWSQDGSQLRFHLQDPKNATSSFWELTFSDSDKRYVSSLAPLQVSMKDCWAESMTLDQNGRSFVGGGECGRERIHLLAKHQGLWNPQFDLLETNAMVHNIRDLTLDRESRTVFAIGEYSGPQNDTYIEHLELLRFDQHFHAFRPFLSGIPANHIDFSRDGSLIAYIRIPDQTLWVSRPDGSSAREIDVRASNLELPRWSPDGRLLAFMQQSSGKPWRIFVVPANGGKPREASSGTDNQGAPTWSPDGRWLVYGNVECQESGTCAIHKIELSTGREFTVPGSEGLGTARWSPDGKHIAALNPELHEVLAFDMANQKWRKLIDGVNGNDLSWSADSKSLFASRPVGNQPEILRISLSDSRPETAVDLRSFTALTGHVNTWFTLAPDDSIIFSREMTGNEIFSLSYAER